MIHSEENVSKRDKLYSWDYYQWWFLNNMWSINNSYWLNHLVGTPFYNSYLRWCGAKIGCHSHIYTTLIDTPWLIEVGESTFIDELVVLSSLSYQDQIYELHRIQIGSYCSINIRSVLYDNVLIDDDVYVEPMSAITGYISTSNDKVSRIDRSLPFSQRIYQFICLFCLLFIHAILISSLYLFHNKCLTLFLPLPVSLASIWLVWILMSLFISVLLLKFIVGSVTPGYYPINSHYYLHKLWLRQLIITSFHHALSFVPSHDVLPLIIFRWLGAHIADDVKLGEIQQILRFPSNLLNIEHDVTTFTGAMFASFEMTKEGLCYFDEIHLDSGINLGNWCTIMPGTRIPSGIIVGSLTLVTRTTVSDHFNSVLLGIPACEIPFAMSDHPSITDDMASANSLSIHNGLLICLTFFISKCFLITIYSLLPLVIALFIHLICGCALYDYSISAQRRISQFQCSEVVTHLQHCLNVLIPDFFDVPNSYLSGTQFLVFIFRIFGAQIGSDVIISDLSCIADPHLVSIGDHVRLHRNAYIQVRHIYFRLLFI
jgi:acetyltransferase-like isoleucine patch superfamily enzyme